MRPSRAGFTLVELLVVIAIVAILAVVVLLVLNPAQLLKQSRDSNRIAELTSLNKALSLYATDVGTSGLGSANVVYVSIPDTTSTCANLHLPTLPAGWSYNCVTATSTRNTDGTGWIPVNFQSISFKSPLGTLPIDPVNVTSTRSYYTYTTSGGKYQLSAQFESDKYEAKSSADGGTDPAVYEAGTNKSLAPFIGGLVGWWKFDETGTVAQDSSGYGKNGTTYITSSTVGDAHATSGCLSGGCLSGDGVGKFMSVDATGMVDQTETVLMFLKSATANCAGGFVVSNSAWGRGRLISTNNINFTDTSANYYYPSIASACSTTNVWHQIGYSKSSVRDVTTYVDGAAVESITAVANIGGAWGVAYFGRSCGGTGCDTFFNGLIDDVRVYNRALSAAEVAAIYNANR